MIVADFRIFKCTKYKSGFTPNQKAALPNVKTPFVIDRTTSTQFQKGVQSTVNFGVQQGTNRLNND